MDLSSGKVESERIHDSSFWPIMERKMRWRLEIINKPRDNNAIETTEKAFLMRFEHCFHEFIFARFNQSSILNTIIDSLIRQREIN